VFLVLRSVSSSASGRCEPVQHDALLLRARESAEK